METGEPRETKLPNPNGFTSRAFGCFLEFDVPSYFFLWTSHATRVRDLCDDLAARSLSVLL